MARDANSTKPKLKVDLNAECQCISHEPIKMMAHSSGSPVNFSLIFPYANPASESYEASSSVD